MNATCRISLAFGATAFLSVVTGCAGVASLPLSAAATQGNAASRAEPPLHHASRPDAGDGSWMAPDAQKADLLYVSTVYTVSVYAFPQGKLVGRLMGFYAATGECVGQSGDVFITNLGTAQIFEYAHGGKTRIATLRAATVDPDGCSVDPTTGNLAVTSLGDGGGGVVAIYGRAKGNPKTYTDPSLSEYHFCGYDPAGDLFVDGQDKQARFEFAELPKGGDHLVNIALSHAIGFPGAVQWDAGNVAVGDGDANVIYEFAISGTKGILKRSMVLAGAGYVDQFLIRGKTLVGADVRKRAVKYWAFPSGGNPLKTIRTSGATGVAISPATPSF